MIAGAPFTTVLYTSLKNKKPIILLYQNGPIGHAIVLTGAEVTVNEALGEIEVTKFHVFDPFCYRRVIDFKGNRLEEDEELIKKVYHPSKSFNGGTQIEAGILTAVIIIEGAKVD